jgi:hypothetical protein
VVFAGPGAVCAKAGVNPTAATPVKSAAARNGVRNLIISNLGRKGGLVPLTHDLRITSSAHTQLLAHYSNLIVPPSSVPP